MIQVNTKKLSVLVGILFLVIATPLASIASTVGYMDPAKTYLGYGLNDYYMTSATNAVTAQGYTLTSVLTFSASSLAGVNIAFVGLGNSGSGGTVPVAEVTALYNFVLGGGSLVLQGDNDAFNNFQNSVANAFGVNYSGAHGPATFFASQPIINGPFGLVSSYSANAPGQLFSLGAYAQNLISDSGGDGIVGLIDYNVLGSGSGAVVFLTDVNAFDNGGFSSNSILWNNIFAYVGQGEVPVPEPATFILLGVGLIGFARLRRRIR